MFERKNSMLLLVLTLLLAGCATPLVKASEEGDTKTAAILLDKGADVNERYQGFTPLMWAAYCGKLDTVKLLVERNADINAITEVKYTALHFAVMQGQVAIAKTLIEKGANVNIVSDEGTPLQIAEKKGYTELVPMLKAAQLAQLTKEASSKNMPVAYSGNAVLIAVIDFEAKGVSRQDASRLSEWLRTELINTNQFKVIERSAMNAILKEQAFTMTGCTDTSCAVQVGKMLSARKMLVGSVEVWNNKVFINGRIIDVEKGVAEFAHRETVSSLKELDTGATSFAKNLARRINGLPVE